MKRVQDNGRAQREEQDASAVAGKQHQQRDGDHPGRREPGGAQAEELLAVRRDEGN